MVKRISVVILFISIFMANSFVSYADNVDGTYFPDSECWTNITTKEAVNLVDNQNAKDSFVFVYYRETCGYSRSMLPLIHYYSEINDIDFYALENNSNGAWNWSSVVQDGTITFPLVVVYNKQKGIMVGDSDVHSDEDFRKLVRSAKLDLNFSSEIKVKIGSKYIDFNGKMVETDVPATIINDRTMIPVRVISELFGAKIQYIAQDVNNKFRVLIDRGNRSIYLFENYKKIDVYDGYVREQYPMDTAPVIIDGRTLVPARALAEGLGFTVSWDAANGQAIFSLE